MFQTTPNVWQWDFDARNGPIINGREEFEGILTHEVIHTLGFLSTAGPNAPTNMIHNWDLYRFDESLPQINPTVVTTTPRMLDPTVPTIYATRMNLPAYLYKASPNEHWRSFQDPTVPNPIGIMDPAPTGALISGLLRFYSLADLRALDIIGWNLIPNNLWLLPTSPIPLGTPSGASYITSVTPTFTWGPDPQNDKWHVTIFEGLTTDPSATVLAPRDLTTEFYTVPASTPLADATTYTWLVAGETIAGFVYSESSTFTVCYADCDQSTGPGVLDIFDFLCFQNAYVALDPYACDCDTSTGPGVCDLFDFLCFQNAFTLGCP